MSFVLAFFFNEYLGKCRLFTANGTLVRLYLCQQENCSTWPRTVLYWVPPDNINQVGYTFDTMAAAVSINISVGMRPHAHTHSGCERVTLRDRKTKGQLSRRHSYVLMQASATVWSGATFPPHCSGFTAVNLSHTQCWEKEVADLCQVLPSQSSHCGVKLGSEW